MLQETLKELFPSWEAVMRFRQVITFTTGLMKDPIPLVLHIYKMQIEDYLNRMRTDGYPSIDADLFKLLYIESTVPLPHHPLHNEYFNYYNHKEDDKKKRPRDTTNIYVPSRLLVLHTMMDDVFIESTGNTDIPECAMSIQEPSPAVSKSLLTTCFRICEDQPITDLRIAEVNVNKPDHLDSNGFNLSENIQSMSIRECQLSHEIQNHLLQQLSKGQSLIFLDLQGTAIAEDGHQIANSINSWKGDPSLSKLKLGYCSMPTDVSAELLRSLASCQQLTYLDLSGNNLAGSLLNFLPDPHPGLPSLARLELNSTSLNKEDVQHLKNLIKMKKVPGLRSLGLMGNRLHEMEEVKGLISNCIDYYTKNLNLKIKDEGQPEEFETKWMRVLEGKHVSINVLDDDVSSFNVKMCVSCYKIPFSPFHGHCNNSRCIINFCHQFICVLYTTLSIYLFTGIAGIHSRYLKLFSYCLLILI